MFTLFNAVGLVNCYLFVCLLTILLKNCGWMLLNIKKRQDSERRTTEYLRQRGTHIIAVCLSVCLSVSKISVSYWHILTKVRWRIQYFPRKKWLKFGIGPDCASWILHPYSGSSIQDNFHFSNCEIRHFRYFPANLHRAFDHFIFVIFPHYLLTYLVVVWIVLVFSSNILELIVDPPVVFQFLKILR